MDASHIPPVEDSPYPVRTGNRVRPLIGGERAFRRILEAVDGARNSVWVTVAFLQEGFTFPDGQGDLFQVLDRAAGRGLDVRVIFWRSPEAYAFEGGGHYLGTEEDHRDLESRSARFAARWDRLDKTYCHHQKSWVVDAGEPGEVAFVGGINLNQGSLTSHPFPEGNDRLTQDIYCELGGPVATDVHHNFVQRWNGASERDLPLGAWPEPASVDDLPFPEKSSPACGDVPVQLSRTVRRGFYQDETPPPGGRAFPLSGGEYSVLRQYVDAIDAAREAIYLENQSFVQPDVFTAVESALERGVSVVALVPSQPSVLLQIARQAPGASELFDRLTAIAEHPRFTLAGLAANRSCGRYQDVYVHTKAAIVDDAWATIGSTNIANRSFFGDTELNASFWHAEAARAFRNDLLSAHHGADLSALPFSEALEAFAERARRNRERRAAAQPLEGHAFELDASRWGEPASSPS